MTPIDKAALAAADRLQKMFLFAAGLTGAGWVASLVVHKFAAAAAAFAAVVPHV